MHLFYWCMGYILGVEFVGQMCTLFIFLVPSVELASRKELAYQQLRNKLLSLLFCPFNKQNCSFFFCILLITEEFEHLQNVYGYICFFVL